MNKKLANLLEKRKIKDLKDLDPDEKADFDRWTKILSEGEITVDKILDFCKSQISIIENKWKASPTSWEENAKLIPYHTVYSSLSKMITTPRADKKSVEEELDSLLKM